MWTFARKILLHDRIKFAVASAGVSVSVLLVLVQIGLYFGFMQNASDLIDHASADIWVTREANDNFDFASPMDERLAYRVAEEPGVERIERVIVGFGLIKGEAGDAQGVQVVGLEPRSTMLRPWNVVKGDVDAIARGDAVLVDTTEYPKLHISDIGQEREISGARARVAAMSSGIRSFTTSPYIWTNLDSARIYTRFEKTQLTYLLVKAAPGVDPIALTERLSGIPNIDAYTKQQMSQRTREYWSSRTGVGVGFLTTAIIGVVVGIVVVGQILYSGTLEHLKEYGTMKAMGAKNGEIVRIILYQALFSAAVGFVLGGGLSLVARVAMAAVNLRLLLSPALFAGTAMLTIVMCSAASLLSITKVLQLDPASVFKA